MCCGRIETERSPFLQGHKTHSLRSGYLSTNLWPHVFVGGAEKGQNGRGHFLPRRLPLNLPASTIKTESLDGGRKKKGLTLIHAGYPCMWASWA